MRVHSSIREPSTWRYLGGTAAFMILLSTVPARAATIDWAGRTWKVTSGGMAGVAQGSPNNVSVDESGYLHLKISNTGGTWTAAEIFSSDKLGFGTYQWQVDGPIDHFDQNVVLGLFPYGPAAGIGTDGTNEIDIEYAFWGHPTGTNGDWTDYPNSGTTIGEKSYKFSLSGGTFSTSRFIWSSSSIQNFLISGFEPVTSTNNLLNSWTYAPTAPQTNIPQQAMPLGMNLWCFGAPPSDGKDVEVVIRDFEFIAEGTNPPGTGGSGGGGTSAGSAGTNSGGTSAAGAAGSSTGGTSAGGASAGAGAANAGASNTAGGNAAAGSSSTSDGAGGGVNASGSSNLGLGGASGTTNGVAGTANGVAGTANGVAGNASSNPANGSTSSGDSSDSGGCTLGAAPRDSRTTLLFALPLASFGLGLRRRKARR
ncbi:MAG TPA: glycoside hydrolase family 16 protein [Polyangiaceae bacterium]|nr:glycoside hydrolase family 16 protein [Polyangiaceae bacterium]